MIRKIATVMMMVFALLNAAAAHGRVRCPPQGKRLTAQQYVNLYKDEAQRQMRKYGVPASITLAQGMLESGYGSSYLAVVANNHFGIKAYSRGWKGPVVRCDDDSEAEPFCKFPSVQYGFEYHSTFLRDNSRYAPLFRLDPTDYESWAHGLKKCGYATNPRYADHLISLIEANHLDLYDVTKGSVSTYTGNRHKLYKTARRRGLKYVYALSNDDLSYIGAEFGISKRKLRSWNDMTKKSKLQEGDIVYLQEKRSRADKRSEYHIVSAGESMWSISQRYGIKVKHLMKRNNLVSATVREGQVLKLR